MFICTFFDPQAEWLSFRYLLKMGATYEHLAYPLYARIYGGIMGIMEIGASGIILLWKMKNFYLCLIVLVVNMAGCLFAVLLGDFFAIVCLLLRLIPLLLIKKEMQINRE